MLATTTALQCNSVTAYLMCPGDLHGIRQVDCRALQTLFLHECMSPVLFLLDCSYAESFTLLDMSPGCQLCPLATQMRRKDLTKGFIVFPGLAGELERSAPRRPTRRSPSAEEKTSAKRPIQYRRVSDTKDGSRSKYSARLQCAGRFGAGEELLYPFGECFAYGIIDKSS
jgi:hypothetical protein